MQKTNYILVTSMKYYIPVPKLYQADHKYILEIKINNTSLKLFVIEFIDGKNYWELNRELSDNELKQVAKIAAKINLIDYEIISQIVNDFESIDFNQMKHTYIHVDIIKANLILDKTGKIYIIDFSAFNYLPRIIEISASLLGLCLTDDKKSTINKINNFLNYYNKYNTLENDYWLSEGRKFLKMDITKKDIQVN